MVGSTTGDSQTYRPGAFPDKETKIERMKKQFGEAALSQLAVLAAPIKKENDDPLADLF